MADPLSITASAAGIISLGLQVTEEIILYCDAYKFFDQDVQNLNHKADGLSRTLEYLDDVLRRIHSIDPSSRREAEHAMDTVSVTLNRLNVMMNQIPKQPNTSKAGKFKARIMYPLHKQSLIDATALVNSLQQNVETVIGVLLLVQGVKASQTHQALHHDFKAHDIALKAQIAALDARMENMESTIKSMAHSRGQVSPQLLHRMQNKNDHTIAAMDRVLAYPAISRTQRKQGQVLRKKIVLCSRFLSFSLSLSFSVTHGAVGYSISPSLTYQGRAPYYFRHLIKFGCDCSPDYIPDYLPDCTLDRPLRLIRRCDYLFRTRVIRPSDRDKTGSNMLDAVFALCFCIYPTEHLEHEDVFLSFMEYFRSLGFWPGDNNSLENHYLDAFIRRQRKNELSYRLVIERLISAGCDITDSALAPHSRELVRYAIANHAEVLLSVPARIIAMEDEAGLSSLIARGQLSAIDVLGHHQAIYLVIGWPAGLCLLLQTTSSPFDGCLRWLAIEAGCMASVKLLLAAGIPLHSHYLKIPEFSLSSLVSEPYYLVKSVWRVGSPPLAFISEVEDLLIDEFIVRRRELRDLAIQHLPRFQWQALGLSSSTLPQFNAPAIHDALLKEGIRISPRLDPREFHYSRNQGDRIIEYVKIVHNIYQLPSMSIMQLDHIYEAGFVDIDTPDDDGRTPLMITYHGNSLQTSLSRAQWLISKGGKPSTVKPGSATPAGHIFIQECLVNTYTLFSTIQNEFDGLSPDIRTFLQEMLVRDLLDNSCGCSSSGCTPFSYWLKNESYYDYWNGAPIILRNLCPLLPSNPSSVEIVIRLLTFKDLNLTHVCFNYDREAPLDDSDVEAIQEEQGDGLRQLDQLVEGFVGQYEKLNIPLYRFLEEHWSVKMQDYLQQEQPLSDERRNRIQEMGVVDLCPTEALTEGMWCVRLRPKAIEVIEA